MKQNAIIIAALSAFNKHEEDEYVSRICCDKNGNLLAIARKYNEASSYENVDRIECFCDITEAQYRWFTQEEFLCVFVDDYEEKRRERLSRRSYEDALSLPISDLGDLLHRRMRPRRGKERENAILIPLIRTQALLTTHIARLKSIYKINTSRLP